MLTGLLEEVHLALASKEPKIVRVLGSIAVLFGLAHLATVLVLASVGRERLHGAGLLFALGQFNLEGEQNLPTFFSCALLAFAGALLLLIARRVRAAAGPMPRHWLALAGLFFAMSFDEFGSVHEHLGDFLRIHFHAPEHGALHFTWVVVGLPFAATVGSIYLPFLLALPARLRNGIFLSGAVYVSGALGMELLDGWYVDYHGVNTVYAVLTMVEELLEMAGVILFIRCLLRVAISERQGDVAPALVFSASQAQKRPTDGSLHPWASTR